MTLQEIRQYFDDNGGRRGVKDRDSVWPKLVGLYNSAHPKNRLTFSCGSCRSTAYKWLLTVTSEKPSGL